MFALIFLSILGIAVAQQTGVSNNPADAAPQVIDGQIFGPGYALKVIANR